MKDEGLSKCDYLWARETQKYQDNNDYTIFLNEYEIWINTNLESKSQS